MKLLPDTEIQEAESSKVVYYHKQIFSVRDLKSTSATHASPSGLGISTTLMGLLHTVCKATVKGTILCIMNFSNTKKIKYRITHKITTGRETG